MSALKGKVRYVMGEHDYYLDLGEYWSKGSGTLTNLRSRIINWTGPPMIRKWWLWRRT
jgi:hypothetical protein